MTERTSSAGRPMSIDELADFVTDLSAAGVGAAGLGQADVYVIGSGAGADRCIRKLGETLEPFGMHIVPVPVPVPVPVEAAAPRPALRLVSMHRPGPPAVWSEEEVDDLVGDVRAERLGHWALCAARTPRLQTLHRPGSDSIGVVEFDCATGRLVAKVGPADVMLAEQDHVRRTHESGARIFPVPRGYEVRDGLATRIMDAVKPAGLVEEMFRPGPDGLLRASASELCAIDEHLRVLTAWYADSLADGEPEVARYLYVDRFVTLPLSEPYRRVGDRVLGTRAHREALDVVVSLPDGSRTCYRELVSWLADTYPEWCPTRSTAVHGDIFTSNLMRGSDGEVRFIDPRSAWDGTVQSRTGRGDPFFDLGTLLHALSPMVTVLDACARGLESELLPDGVLTAGCVDATTLVTVADAPARVAYLRRITELTGDWADPGFLVRLHVASACSLLGWLKYDKTIRTPSTWWGVFLAVVADLARARLTHNGLDPAFTHEDDCDP